MELLDEYRSACTAEAVARLRRVLVLRAMLAMGDTQRQVAKTVSISQPAVSQQLKAAAIEDVDLVRLIDAGGPILRRVAQERGFSDLAVFGSVARGEAHSGSDIDLLVRPPRGTTIAELLALQRLFEAIVGRPVDLMTYGGLKPGVDDDILEEAALL